MSKSFHIPEIILTCKIKGSLNDAVTISSPDQVVEFLRAMMSRDGMILFKEEAYMICLNQAGKVIGWHRLSSGGLTTTVMDTRIVAQICLMSSANRVIVAHNHPSGNLQPSKADIDHTIKMRDGLKLLDIQLLDHFIITDTAHYSLNEEGMM